MQKAQGGGASWAGQPLHGQQFGFAQCKSLQVTNLHPDVTEKDLEESFAYVDIVRVQIISTDSDS
jgi:hypothetical protein